MRCAWATDLHLPFVKPLALNLFKQEVKDANLDCLFICGDISEGADLEKWIDYLNNFFIDVYFCLGNHDFYKVCNIKDFQKNVFNLTRNTGLIYQDTQITDDTTVIINDGWYDCGFGKITNNVVLRDFFITKDFAPYGPALTVGHKISIALVKEIKKVANREAEKLKASLNNVKTDKVILITHSPPFENICLYNGGPTGEDYIPFFCSKIAGDVLMEYAKANLNKDILVLSGHTHHKAEGKILPNLRVKVGGAKYGFPKLQEIFDV